MKKIISFFLAAVCVLGLLPVSVLAAAVSWPAVSTSRYCEFIAQNDIPVYRNSSLTTRGTSSPAKSYNAYAEEGDTCRILTFNKNYLKISYPTSSGNRTGYIKRSDVIDVNAPIEAIKSEAKVNTYRYAGSGSVYGYAAAGDKVYNVGTSGQYTHVIYEAKSGNRAYKMGYVKNSDYAKMLAASTDTGYADPNKLVSDTEMENAVSAYRISKTGNAYKALLSINTEYASHFTDSQKKGVLIFMFEGVGNSSSSKSRMNAMCVVVKNGRITYLNRNSSTIPDYPFDPAKNDDKDMPTLKSGIYSFKTVNHNSSYAALKVCDAEVLRFSDAENYYDDTSDGINVHRRSSNSIASAKASWVNSAGCLLVGKTGTGSSSEYAKFIQTIGIVKSNASATEKYRTKITGKIVIDRSYAEKYLSNVGYSDDAIDKLG